MDVEKGYQSLIVYGLNCFLTVAQLYKYIVGNPIILLKCSTPQGLVARKPQSHNRKTFILYLRRGCYNKNKNSNSFNWKSTWQRWIISNPKQPCHIKVTMHNILFN